MRSDDALLARAFPDIVDQIRSLIRGPPIACVVTAPPGTGLTTLLMSLIREEGLSPIRFTSAQTRLKGTLANTAVRSVGVDFKPKCVVLDEFDVMLDDPLSSPDVIGFLAGTVKLHVVCAGRALPKTKLKGPVGKLTTVTFPDPPLKLVADILASLGYQTAPDTTDLRGHIVQAQVALRFQRDDFRNSTCILEECASEPTTDTCLNAFVKDPVIRSIVRENYALVTDDLDAVRDVSECYSLGDLLERKSFRNAELSDALGAVMLGLPLAILRQTGVDPGCWSDKKHGVVWSHCNHLATKTKALVATKSSLMTRNLTTLEDLAIVSTLPGHADTLWQSAPWRSGKRVRASSKKGEKTVGETSRNGRRVANQRSHENPAIASTDRNKKRRKARAGDELLGHLAGDRADDAAAADGTTKPTTPADASDADPSATA